jgi:hypothetical protein
MAIDLKGPPVPEKSKNIASVGDTMMASRARIPEVPFTRNSHPPPATRGLLYMATNRV